MLGLDPGTDKCGVALVSPGQGVLHREVVALADLGEVVTRLLARFPVAQVALGASTGRKQVRTALAEAGIGLPIVEVSEKMTSLLARQRYWQEHPLRGLARLFPVGLRVPPRPVDDYAAAIIAERLIQQQSQEN